MSTENKPHILVLDFIPTALAAGEAIVKQLLDIAGNMGRSYYEMNYP